MRIDIYVVTHKEYVFPTSSIYKPIVAGAFEYPTSDFPENYLRDDQLDNISYKHDLFSEYTVTYWAWKNSCADIVGINHYRRYFIKGGWLNYLICLLNPPKFLNKFILDEKDITTIFSNGYNCILPKKQWRVNRTLKEEFIGENHLELLSMTEQIIKECFSVYAFAYDSVMSLKENYQKCLCIMDREHFDSYASWMFCIFDKLVERGFNGNNREFAFLGERLLNVWVFYQESVGELKVSENFFVNTEFSYAKFFKNHTEFILPKWIRNILNIGKKMGANIILGNGHLTIHGRGQGRIH